MSSGDVSALAAAVSRGDRRALARAITLAESRLPDDERDGAELLERLLPRTGNAYRLGVTGPPGVGKSTFIDALGTRLVEKQHAVAVLAVDPSSAISGGSLLGDKTRMPNLAAQERAFIRPSPNAAAPGGVARRTRETMLLCEAAGFDVVILETVGVGQAEIEAREMVDVLLLLAQPGAGDELQGMKRGIVELADVVCVTKADGDLLARARETAAELGAALRLAASEGRRPEVLLVSARMGTGLDELWAALHRRREEMVAAGELAARRERQRVAWLWRRVEDALLASFREQAVRTARTTPERAARRLLDAFGAPPPRE